MLLYYARANGNYYWVYCRCSCSYSLIRVFITENYTNVKLIGPLPENRLFTRVIFDFPFIIIIIYFSAVRRTQIDLFQGRTSLPPTLLCRCRATAVYLHINTLYLLDFVAVVSSRGKILNTHRRQCPCISFYTDAAPVTFV